MVTILQEQESTPSAYPSAPSGLSTAAAAIDKAIVWKRLESWITRRYPVRSVEWIVEGCGQFVPRLTPATLTKAERWDDDAWATFTPTAGPLGYCLKGGTYRLTFDVGETTPPETVMEAYRRIAEYWAEGQPLGGMTSVTDGDFSATWSRDATARALQSSGAADLLRAFR